MYSKSLQKIMHGNSTFNINCRNFEQTKHIFNKSGGRQTTCPLFMLSLSLPRKWHFFCTIRNHPPRILTTPTHHTKARAGALALMCSVFGFVPGAMRAFYAGLMVYLLHIGKALLERSQSVTCALLCVSHPPPCSFLAAN